MAAPEADSANVLVVSGKAVEELLPMSECIWLAEEALRQTSREKVAQPIRIRFCPARARGFLGWMPGFMEESRTLGTKVVSVFEPKSSHGGLSHQGVVMLFDAESGSLQALVDAATITALRTAATSAAATKILARPEAHHLAILGYGIQAERHVEAMLLVREVRSLSVWGRSQSKAAAFAIAMADRFGLKARASSSAAEAVRTADIVCTTTASPTPILTGADLPTGCHLNVVGSSFPDAQEIDVASLARSRLYVDSRAMVKALGGEYLAALAQGAISPDHLVGEVGQVLIGAIEGRTSPDQITLFKSLGLAAEDLVSANFVYQKAKSLATLADSGVQLVRL